MHTLIVPSYYPNTYNMVYGVYFKVHADALYASGLTVGVLSPIIIKHYMLKKSKKIDYGFKNHSENYPTYLYQIPSFPIIKRINDYMRLYFGKKLFKKYINEYGLPDIIHLQSFENGILTRWIKKHYKIPYVVTEHSSGFHRNIYSEWQLKLAYKAFNDSDQIFTVSETLQKTLRDKLNVNTEIIPNMINTILFRPNNLEKRFDFISIGNLLPAKNYDLLLTSFSKFCKSHPESKLIIIGEGYLRKDVESIIENLNLKNNVQLLGAKTQSEIIDYLNQSKIYLSSSSIETFGISIIEAMSCGLPVLSTKSGGPEGTIQSEELGLLCEHNQESYSNALETIYSNYSKFDPKIIRNHVVNNYSTTAISNKYIEVYNKYSNNRF